MIIVFGIEKIHFVYDKKERLHREEMREVVSVYLQMSTASNALKKLYENEQYNGHYPKWTDIYKFETSTFTEMGVEGVSFEYRIVDIELEKTFN
jgi:hypothetical protein